MSSTGNVEDPKHSSDGRGVEEDGRVEADRGEGTVAFEDVGCFGMGDVEGAIILGDEQLWLRETVATYLGSREEAPEEEWPPF